MSRLARKFSLTGLYHIVFRGINKQNIFEETEDYQKMIKTLQVLKKELKFEIYTYCLMSNHVHLLLKEKNMGDISQIMRDKRGRTIFVNFCGICSVILFRQKNH